MSAFAPRSLAALRVEAEVIRTLKDILAENDYPGAEIVVSTVRVLNKDVIGPRRPPASLATLCRMTALMLEEVVNRNLETERWLILEAAKAYGFDGTELADFAMARAGYGPWRDLLNRDWGKDAKEEGGDGLMYGCASVEQLRLFPDSEQRCEAMSHVGELMRCAAGLAYHSDCLRTLMREIRDTQPVAHESGCLCATCRAATFGVTHV